MVGFFSLLITGVCEDSDYDDDDDGCDGGGDDGCDLEGLAPTPKHRKLAREEALKKSRTSGCYPKFDGCEGPAQLLDPSCNNALEFLLLLWPTSLFVTNVFPEQMDSKVARVQPDSLEISICSSTFTSI